jgi:hypothetical protein
MEKECNNHKLDYDDHPIRIDFVGCKIFLDNACLDSSILKG